MFIKIKTRVSIFLYIKGLVSSYNSNKRPMGVNNNSPWKAAEILENLSTKGKPQKTKSNGDILSPHVFFLLLLPLPAVFLLQCRNGPQDHSFNALMSFASQRPLLTSSFFLPSTEIPSPFLLPWGTAFFPVKLLMNKQAQCVCRQCWCPAHLPFNASLLF